MNAALRHPTRALLIRQGRCPDCCEFVEHCDCAHPMPPRAEPVAAKASAPIYRGAFEPDDFGNAEPCYGLTEDDE
jgi:hypothetical protein